MPNAPWNVDCGQCDQVKNKTVPQWLANGIALDRSAYDTVGVNWQDVPRSSKIDAAMDELRAKFKKEYGDAHLSQ